MSYISLIQTNGGEIVVGKYLIIILLAASSLFAQAKVGTTGAQFLDQSPSVTANGMGAVGVTSTTDRGYFYNPATLGLLDCKRVRLSLCPVSPDWPADVKYYSQAVGAKLITMDETNPLSLALSYHAVWLKSGYMTGRSYNQGAGNGTDQGFSWSDYSHQLTLAMAYSKRIEVSGGLTCKLIHEVGAGRSANGVAFDLGGLVRIPMDALFSADSGSTDLSRIRLDVGLSVSNFGPDLEFIDREYPLPRMWRGGIGVNIQVASLTVYPAIQIDRDYYGHYQHHFGFEADLHHAVAGRIGTYQVAGDYQGTWGATVKSAGIYELLFGRKWLLPFSVEASYAYMETYFSGGNYYGIELVL